ncbi:hypothetical protein BJ875DRAFT_447000 [Amylocarpus encephaloides]|uniref:Uncharacterized protein n=1 Tax=Amylocarpus encephaloides TaxID=45428 RepID=A0A9P8BZ16_9HELO|nr:hypothetical protein BJ875DRAFT_447000 [Amylocarpus encephaloides]
MTIEKIYRATNPSSGNTRPNLKLTPWKNEELLPSPAASDDVTMKDFLDENSQQPSRKRHTFGKGISARSASPFRDSSPPLSDIKSARPLSAPGVELDSRKLTMFDSQRPHVEKKTL